MIGIRINKILVTFQRIIANDQIPGAIVEVFQRGSIGVRSTIKVLLFTSVDPIA
jgi:hypothetical protein